MFSVGAETADDGACGRCVVGQARVGAGLAKAALGQRLLAHARLDVRVQGGDLDGAFGGPLRAGIGPAAVLRWRIRPSLTLLGSGAWLQHPGQSPGSLWEADAILRWGLGPRVALSLEGHAEDRERHLQLMTLFYF